MKRTLKLGLTAFLSASTFVCSVSASADLKCFETFQGTTASSTSQTNLGDLSSEEIAAIQQIVDSTNFPLVVVGSAAQGRRRNRLKPVPIGRGPSQRSGIDYAFPTRNTVEKALAMHEGLAGSLKPIYAQLPSINGQYVLFTTDVETSNARIWFTPGKAPQRIEPGEPNEPTNPFPYPIPNRDFAIRTIRVLTRVAERHLGDRNLFIANNPARAKVEEDKANEILATINKLEQDWDIPGNPPPEPFVPTRLR